MSTLLPHPGGVEQFNNSGTALSKQQLAAKAQRKGLCLRCGIKTHSILFARRTPLTNTHVHDGHCIKCEPDLVPTNLCIKWEQENPDKIALAKRTELHTHRGVHRQKHHGQHRRAASSFSAPKSPIINSSTRTGKTEVDSSSNDDESNKIPAAGATAEQAPRLPDLLGPPKEMVTTIFDNPTASRSLHNDRCQICGIQTHEQVKVKTSFLKKNKTELRPLTMEGAVLAGRCLLCFPIPTTNNHGTTTTDVLKPPPSPKPMGAIAAPNINDGEAPPLVTATSSHTTGHSPPKSKTAAGMTRRSSAPTPPISPSDSRSRPRSEKSLLTASSRAASAVEEDLPPQPPVSSISITPEEGDGGPVQHQNSVTPDNSDWANTDTVPLSKVRLSSKKKASKKEKNREEKVQVPLPDTDKWGNIDPTAPFATLSSAKKASTKVMQHGDIEEPHQQEPSGSLAPELGHAEEEAQSTLPLETIPQQETPVIGIPISINFQPESEDNQPPQEHDVDSTPDELNSSQDPPGDPPEEGLWPLPWPLNKNAEKEEAGEEEASDDEAEKLHGSFSVASSMHRSITDLGTRIQMQDSQSGSSYAMSSFQASNSFAGSSRQLMDSSFAGSRQSFPYVPASVSSHMDASMAMSTSNLLGPNTMASSNSLMVEMTAAGDLSAWMQDIAAEARESEEFRAEASERGGIVAIVSAMKLNKTNGVIQQQGCIALHALAREHGTAIAKNGGVNALISAMKYHGPQDPELQENAAGALVYAVVNDGYKLAFAKKGGVPCILEAMRRHIGHVGVQKRSCMALLKLSSHRDVIDSLANPRQRGTHIVLESMRRHKDDLAISQYASGILKNVAQKDSARTTIVKEGGIAAIVGAMKLHETNVILTQQAIWALAEISATENIAKHGALGSAIRAMIMHSKDETIQQHGCGVIANLSINKENIYATAKMRGIGALLEAMTNHAGNAALQRYACRAIKHLSLSGTNERSIGKRGGIAVLVATMRAHEMDGTVQREAIGALRNLTLSDDNKAKVKKGHIEAIFNAIKNSVHDTGLQAKAAGALLNLSSCPDVRGSMTSEGITDIISMMRQQSNSATVIELLCGALKNLALSADLKKTIAENEGINAILSAMKRHNSDSKMLTYAIGALKNLAGNNENRQAIAKQKGIIATLTIMKRHVSVATLQQEGNMALLNLSVLGENSVATGKHGGIAVITTGMKQHHECPGVQSSACAVLWNLSIVPANQALSFKCSGIPLIIDALKSHIKVLAVCHKACLALSNMAVSNAYRDSIIEHRGIEAIKDAMKYHVRDASCQKYACKFLASMLDGGDEYKRAVGKNISAVKVALQYHSENTDLKAYAHKIIVAISFDDDAVDDNAPDGYLVSSIDV